MTSNVHRLRCHRGQSDNQDPIIEVAAEVETEEIPIKVATTISKVSKDFHLNSSNMVNRTIHRIMATTSSNLATRIIKVSEEVEADPEFRAVGIKAINKVSINEVAEVDAEVDIKVPLKTIKTQKLISTNFFYYKF